MSVVLLGSGNFACYYIVKPLRIYTVPNTVFICIYFHLNYIPLERCCTFLCLPDSETTNCDGAAHGCGA